jgi:hypothetical protein
MRSDYPKIRHGLEALPVVHQGRHMLLVRDRLGLSPDSLLLSPPAAQIVFLMNGENSLLDLQAFYARMTGEILFSEKLTQIVHKLEEHYFLENENFTCLLQERISQFLSDPVRRPAHAGVSYSSDPESLRVELEGFLAREGSRPPFPVKSAEDHGRKVAGIVAPHIDLKAGGPCFARAYEAGLGCCPPGTWIVLGTGHEPIENYFALCPKDFETPIGIVPCDVQCCEELVTNAPRDIRVGEYSHCREHTIEFQAVFLACFQPGARIVPLLCSFSHQDWESDRAYIDGMACLIGEIVEKAKCRIGLIASVDLAHVGPRYADPFQPHAGTLREHLRADRELLTCLENCDSAGFMNRIVRERNSRKVCGAAPLYVFAKALEGKARGEILEQSHAVVDNRNSFVTFAAMVFYEQG